MRKLLTSISAVAVLAISSLLGQSQVKTPITNGYIQGSALDYKGFKGVNAAPGVAGSDLATVSQLSSSGVPSNRTLTIGGLAQDLSADRSWLGNVTNDTQTKASIVPNTAPSTGQILVGNAGGTAFAPVSLSGSGATITLNNSGVLTISSIPNASLTNSAITIAGTSTSLGGSISLDTITGLGSNGLVKRTAANTLAIATAKTDYWDTTDFVASGGSHAHGLVPDPGASAGTTKFLREDATWSVPPGGGGGSPGGANTQVQYNNAGAFGGITNSTTDGTTEALTSPKVVTGINDTNGNSMVAFTATASAVDGITVTNAATANPATVKIGGTGTDTNINLELDAKGTGKINTNAVVNVTLDNATTNAVDDLFIASHTSSGTPANGLGVGMKFQLESSTTTGRDAADIAAAWSDVTDATRTAYLDFQTVNSATLGSKMRLFGSGGLSVNSTSDPGAGVINANTGFRIANAAATAGHVLRANGTNYVDAALNYTDLAGTVPAVTSIATTSPISGGTITSTGTLSLLVNVDHAFTAAQSITLNNATTNATDTLFTLDHESSGTPAASFGAGLVFKLEDTTTQNVTAANINAVWSTATHASYASYIDFQAATGGTAPGSKMRLFGSGGLSVNSTTDPGAGIINANTGFQLAAAEFPVASNGLVKRTAANTYSAVAAPTGAVVGDTDTQTLSNKRITRRFESTASTTSWTPNWDSNDMSIQTALAGALTINNPTYTTTNQGDMRMIRIKDNGTARTIAYGTNYRASSDLALPTTTIISKTLYMGFIYNSTDTKWDLIAVLNNF